MSPMAPRPIPAPIPAFAPIDKPELVAAGDDVGTGASGAAVLELALPVVAIELEKVEDAVDAVAAALDEAAARVDAAAPATSHPTTAIAPTVEDRARLVDVIVQE